MKRLILPDTHIPFHDKRVVDRWLKHAAQLRPDGVDIIGDLLDCYCLSRFDKNPERKDSLQDELDQAHEFLREVRSVVGPKCDIRYTEGNHEQRLKRVLWGNCKALSGLRGLGIPQLLKLDELRVQWFPTGLPYRI
ncbi:MAG: hypothetical protein AAB262_07705, partial [Elusimicrobiota bacterium]